MTESHIDASELQPGDDVATPYAPRNGKLTALPTLVWKNNPGAAGIYSSLHDMTKWAETQLAVSNGSQHPLLSASNQQRMWSIITPIDIEPAPIPELQAAQPNFLGYAEGWYVSDYAGQRLVWHTGEFPGTFSQVTLVPALNLGIVVMVNQEAGGIRIYRDAWYGDIEVSLDRTSLRMRFTKSPRLQGTLHPLGSNTFLARWDDRVLDADALIEFTVDQSGRVNGAGMRRASPETPGAYDYQDLHLIRIRPN